MPITLNCPCGKTLRVGDEHASKRVKCPGCAAVLTAPQPQPAFEVVDDPEPPRKSAGDEDDGKPGYKMELAAKTRDQEDEAEAERPKRKRGRPAGEREEVLGLARGAELNARARRRAQRLWEARLRIAYLLGGLILTLIGIGVAVFGATDDGPNATLTIIVGAVVGLCGLVALLQRLTGILPDQ